MRQVYRLLGLVKKWGAERVERACRTALEAETIDVNLIARMLERAREGIPPPSQAQLRLLPGRYARDASEFALDKGAGR